MRAPRARWRPCPSTFPVLALVAQTSHWSSRHGASPRRMSHRGARSARGPEAFSARRQLSHAMLHAPHQVPFGPRAQATWRRALGSVHSIRVTACAVGRLRACRCSGASLSCFPYPSSRRPLRCHSSGTKGTGAPTCQANSSALIYPPRFAIPGSANLVEEAGLDNRFLAIELGRHRWPRTVADRLVIPIEITRSNPPVNRVAADSQLPRKGALANRLLQVVQAALGLVAGARPCRTRSPCGGSGLA